MSFNIERTRKFPSKWHGYIFLLLAQLMVAICIVGSKYLLQSLPAIIILTIRFIIGSIFLFTIHIVTNKDRLQPVRQLTLSSWGFIITQALCAGVLFNILLLHGLEYTSASTAGIITSVLPAIIMILSIIFLKEKVTLYTVLCISFAVLGLNIINAHSLHINNKSQIFGDIIIFISLLPEAAYYVISKFHQNNLPVFLVSGLMNIINVPIFLFFLLFQNHHFSLYLIYIQYLILFLVGIGSAMFYVFWFLGCNKIHGGSVGLSTAFMPISTLILSYLFLNENISLLQILGMSLIICSIVFNAYKQNSPVKKFELSSSS